MAAMEAVYDAMEMITAPRLMRSFLIPGVSNGTTIKDTTPHITNNINTTQPNWYKWQTQYDSPLRTVVVGKD